MIETVEKTLQQTWKLKGVTYLPHYTHPDVFVGPGWVACVTNANGCKTYYPPEYTLLELIGKGAVAEELLLWKRD